MMSTERKLSMNSLVEEEKPVPQNWLAHPVPVRAVSLKKTAFIFSLNHGPYAKKEQKIPARSNLQSPLKVAKKYNKKTPCPYRPNELTSVGRSFSKEFKAEFCLHRDFTSMCSHVAGSGMSILVTFRMDSVSQFPSICDSSFKGFSTFLTANDIPWCHTTVESAFSPVTAKKVQISKNSSIQYLLNKPDIYNEVKSAFNVDSLTFVRAIRDYKGKLIKMETVSYPEQWACDSDKFSSIDWIKADVCKPRYKSNMKIHLVAESLEKQIVFYRDIHMFHKDIGENPFVSNNLVCIAFHR